MTDLRVLFAGPVDVFTLVAHQGSGIRTVADLSGKRIGIGSPGSRQRANMERVIAALGLTRHDFAEVSELSPAEQNRAFCADELDAIVYSVAHPNGLIRDATLTCHGMLIAVSGPAIDRMLSEYQEYERATVPGGTYPANPVDVPTFGVRTVVVTHARMPDAMAYEITRAVFDNFDDFRRLHPAFEALSVTEMAHAGGRAPVHAGAARYYREHGSLPSRGRSYPLIEKKGVRRGRMPPILPFGPLGSGGFRRSGGLLALDQLLAVDHLRPNRACSRLRPARLHRLWATHARGRPAGRLGQRRTDDLDVVSKAEAALDSAGRDAAIEGGVSGGNGCAIAAFLISGRCLTSAGARR